MKLFRPSLLTFQSILPSLFVLVNDFFITLLLFKHISGLIPLQSLRAALQDFHLVFTMKNLGNIVLLLAAGAGYVASLPTVGVHPHQIRAVVHNAAHKTIPREAEKNAEPGVATAAGKLLNSLWIFRACTRPSGSASERTELPMGILLG